MIESSKSCPVCGIELELGHKNGLTTHQCPLSHGVGIDLAEVYRHLQLDELEAMWSGAANAPESTLLSPISKKPMFEVTFAIDDDDRIGNQGENAREMTVEVDQDNHFGWFSFGELRSMPQEHSKDSGAAGMVGVQQMEDGVRQYDHLFDEPEEGVASEQPRQEAALGGALESIARRLRD